MSLYLTDTEVAREVFGPRRQALWKTWQPVWERQGMPKPDPRFGLYYWPSVKAWLDSRHGADAKIVPAAIDGEENWPCQKPRRPASTGKRAAANVLRFGSPPSKPAS